MYFSGFCPFSSQKCFFGESILENGVSEKHLEGYAADHWYENCVHCTDDGYSGANFDRLAWKRLIEDVCAGKVARVLVKDACVIIELNQKSPI